MLCAYSPPASRRPTHPTVYQHPQIGWIPVNTFIGKDGGGLENLEDKINDLREKVQRR